MKFVWAIHWPKSGAIVIPAECERLKDVRREQKLYTDGTEIVRLSYTIERRPRRAAGKTDRNSNEEN